LIGVIPFQTCLSECEKYDELFISACDTVAALDETDLTIPPSELETRWETIVKLTQKLKAQRMAAQTNWQNGKPL